MNSFECSYEQLKHMAVDYLKSLPTLNVEEAENGLKCFNLHYLGVQYEHPSEEVMCVALVKFVGKKFFDRVTKLALG